MAQVPVRAYAFDATFRLRELAPLFENAECEPGGARPSGAEIKQALDEMAAWWPDGSAAIAFDFGAVVFFGVKPEVRDRVVQAIGATLQGEPHEPLTEDMMLEVTPGAAPVVEFNHVVVDALSPPVVSIVGLLVAQSAAMDYYEEDVGEILARTERITRDLATDGRLRGRVKDLIKFIGGCIATKNGVIETLALFDKPDLTWEVEALDRLYVLLREHLEIDDRFRALEYRLRMIQENMVLLVDLSRQRHSIVLETGVLLLIVIEVVVMLWQMLKGVPH